MRRLNQDVVGVNKPDGLVARVVSPSKEYKMKKKILMTMLFIVSAFMVFFGVNGISGIKPEQAEAAETSSTGQFYVIDANDKNILKNAHEYYQSNNSASVRFYMSDDIFNQMGEISNWVDDSYDKYSSSLMSRHRFVKSLLFVRASSSIAYSIFYQQKEFDYLKNKGVIFDEIFLSDYYHSNTGVYSWDIVNYLNDENKDVTEWYFPVLVAIRQEQRCENNMQSVYEQEIVSTTCTPIMCSSNYISSTRREVAETFLKEAAPGEYSTEYVQFVRKYLNLVSINDSAFMTMHYRRLVNDNADEIPWEGKLFSVLRLYDQNPNYVWKEALRYCSKNGELSDFNVIRRATWQMSPADDYQVGYMQDEETLLLADGYEYDPKTYTVTVKYKPYQANSFAIFIRTNDPNATALYFRSANISESGGKTAITFNTSNLQKRLVNNFGWESNNTNFNNYVIINPYEKTGEVKITQTKDGEGNVNSVIVETTDSNKLVDCVIRLELEVVPPVDLTVTVNYIALDLDSSQNIVEVQKSYTLEKKLLSTHFAKLTKEAFLKGMHDGNNELVFESQKERVEAGLKLNDLDGNAIDRMEISGISSNRNLETAKGNITVTYTRHTLFRISDNLGSYITYKRAYKTNTSMYYGEEFIKLYRNYRVHRIVCSDRNAEVELPEDFAKWSEAKINLTCQLSAGYIIPVYVEYTDKFNVEVEHLQNITYKDFGGIEKKSGLAERKVAKKEVTLDAFKDIYHPTEEELKTYLGLSDLRVIGSFGAVDLDNSTVTFDNETLRINLKYALMGAKIQQVDGSYSEIKIPMSSYADWTRSFGEDWTVMFLNSTEKVIFPDTVKYKRENVYGYFFVSVMKEQVKSLDALFAGFTSDGCKTFYQSKEVKGSGLYKFMKNSPGLLPVVGGTIGLMLGHPVKGTMAGAGAYYSIMSIAEALNDENGTYYSYFSYLDGSSTLPYTSNSKATDFSDNDSAIKNTVQDVWKTVKEWYSQSKVGTYVKIILGIIGGLIILGLVTKGIVIIFRFAGSMKRYGGSKRSNKSKKK